jgi:hypothetical protein
MVVLHCAWGKPVMLSELDCWALVLGVASPGGRRLLLSARKGGSPQRRGDKHAV